MSDLIQYFPEGVALGDAFVNRRNERNLLINRVKNHKHTVLMAPRRYGKTSLVLKVAEEAKLPYCTIDYLPAYNEEYIRQQIVEKIGKLVLQLLPRANKAKQTLLTIFKRMKPELSLGAFGQRLNLHLSDSPLQDITTVLLKLDEVAVHFKKSAVIFMDEFQQISQLKNFHSIEAAIRHAVERSQRIAYVFSGSNRHLLQQMFGEQSRPLYRLCQTINIERMHEAVYVEHLQQLAKQQWQQVLNDEVLARIFHHCECHPFYMNVLCQLLWECSDMLTVDAIDRIWHDYVKAQKRLISQDIVNLSANQRQVLLALAQQPEKEVQAVSFTSALRMPPSSAQQATEILLRKDLVFRDDAGFYRVLDPAMRYYLSVILWDEESL